MRTVPKTSIPVREADVLKAVTDYLAAKRIWFERRNTGAFKGEHNGRRRFVRFSRPGTADVMALIGYCSKCGFRAPCPNPGDQILHAIYWLECKAPTGRQSEAQKEFEREVTEQGMKYAIIRSIEDLKGIGL